MMVNVAGGALYIRDPHSKIVDEQLDSSEIVDLTNADWELILPYLEENERLFGISIENDLLSVHNHKQPYQKVQAIKVEILASAADRKE